MLLNEWLGSDDYKIEQKKKKEATWCRIKIKLRLEISIEP